jgi:peptide deformylase
MQDKAEREAFHREQKKVRPPSTRRSPVTTRPSRPRRPVEIEAEDWLARAFCHEIDHLNGVLFTDYLRGCARSGRSASSSLWNPSPGWRGRFR